MDVELKPSGALSFTFNNILLPDSNVNEPASHGWVHFSIIPKQGIPLPAVLENTAYIYFDLNAPVQTNTTLNTLVLQIPTGLNEAPVNNGVTLMPNPARESVEFNLTEYRAGLEVKIYSARGKLIHRSAITSSKYKVDLENVSPGVLFYHISHPSGTHDLYGKFVVTD